MAADSDTDFRWQSLMQVAAPRGAETVARLVPKSGHDPGVREANRATPYDAALEADEYGGATLLREQDASASAAARPTDANPYSQA